MGARQRATALESGASQDGSADDERHSPQHRWRGGEPRVSSSCLTAFCSTLLLTLGLRLLHARSGVADPSSVSLAGSQVAIKCLANGRYLEASDGDRWLYASSFSHNKPSARFEVEAVSRDLLRSLLRTRELIEAQSDQPRARWDLRAFAAGSGGGPVAAAPAAEAAEWEQEEGAEEDEDAEGAAAAAAAAAAADEARYAAAGEAARLRHATEIVRGEGEWVVLRSEFAAGYVEVVGRGEAEEYAGDAFNHRAAARALSRQARGPPDLDPPRRGRYVVRVAPGGKLSYRSLVRLVDGGHFYRGRRALLHRPAGTFT